MARRPLWIWPNLLSLDAPLVALAWFWMYKQVWLVKYHQPSLPWFLALTVWCIYVTDRLMDQRHSGRSTTRHQFYHQFRNPMRIALLIGLIGALLLLGVQSRGLLLYALPVVLPVAAYFAVSFFDSGGGVSWFKNILAGVGFAYGTAVGVHFRRERSIIELALSPEVVVFALLCIINMIAIDHWESSSDQEEDERGEDVQEAYKGLLLIFLLVLVGTCYWLALRATDFTLQTHKAFYLSIMVGAGCLAFLALLRHLFSSRSLRVLADVAMLLPLPFFYWLLVDYGIVEFGQFGWTLDDSDPAVTGIVD